MTETTNRDFYKLLPPYQQSLSELLEGPAHFSKVPQEWYVVLTDIENSTQGVADGRHEDINLIATGSIIAVLNIAHRYDIVIPFFFGGDGATMLIPPDLLPEVMPALRRHQENTRQNFELELRVGALQLRAVYEKNYQVQLAKLQVDHAYAIPVVFGEGLLYAERVIKGENYDHALDLSDEGELDLSGMECRWNKVKPSTNTKEVVCLLVVFRKKADSLSICKKVVDALDQTYGSRDDRNPISVQGLKLNSSLKKIGAEVKAKWGRRNWRDLLEAILVTFYGQLFYFSGDNGKHYIKRLVELSDTLVLDGRINTVISGTTNQRSALTQALDAMEQAGEILYGLQVCRESIMSCYVRDRNDEHIHFVDGSDGGYTLAAKQLKAKIKLLDD